MPPERFLQAVLEDLTSGHLVNVQQFLAHSVFTIRKKLSHESDQAQQDLSKKGDVSCPASEFIYMLFWFSIDPVFLLLPRTETYFASVRKFRYGCF